MHPKVIDFIKNNEYLIDTADWDTLFDRMYIAFTPTLGFIQLLIC